jgi:hypothetical protein
LNSDKHGPSRQRGNVMIYILIALGLIGGLTVAMSRQANQSSGETLDKETVQMHVSKLQGYAGTAQNVINQMMMSGTTIDNLSLINPTSAPFNTAPHIHKLFHPGGGGLSYEQATKPPFATSSSGTPEGWYVTKRNVQWTPTAATDVVLAAYNIPLEICRELNKKIIGTATPVALVSGTTHGFFTTQAATNLTTAACTGCEGYPSLCVTDPGGTANPTYYIILEAR